MAYRSSIKNKGKNPAFVEYDLHRCRNHNRIISGLQDHSLRATATAIIVHHPVIREVFSASMPMCVLAHWVTGYIRPEMEKSITPYIFNNRVGKGLDRALNCLATQIYEVSKGFTEDCRVCVCDTQGYFPNASQEHAYKILEDYLLNSKDAQRDLHELVYALNLAVYFNKERITRKSPRSEWGLLKKGKSALEKPEGVGMFPGEMIMQMGMTCYCNPVHKWLESQGVRFTVYGDDTAFVVKNKECFLAYILPEYRRRMAEIGCTVHPHKFYCQHYTKGVKFCSQVIKLQRIYVGNRTKNNYFVKVRKWNRKCSLGNIEHCLSSLNSYVGILKRRNAYGILRKGYEMLSAKWKNYITLDDATNTLTAKDGYKHNDIVKLKYSIL